MSFTPVSELNIALDFGTKTLPVGRLAIQRHLTYFEYDKDFLDTGLELSPFKLPLTPELQQGDPHIFEGLPGVFNDSLPDGWGRLLLDRSIHTLDGTAETLTVLDRLTHVGSQGMGALTYQPDYSKQEEEGTIHLDTLAAQTKEVLEGESSDVLEELIALNGSSAGARPKAMIAVNQTRDHITHNTHKQAGYTDWLVKFANITDGDDAGAIEYVYGLMAKDAGVTIEETHLFPAKKSAGYFATKRFDRDGNKRLHMHSACGLVHSDFRAPCLDYRDLITLTKALTRDMREVKKMFQLAVFNVLAHNRDDHSKNFSFLMNEEGSWQCAPAYDLTFSSGPNGEQSTMVMGNGKTPSIEHLIKLADDAGLKPKEVITIIDQTKTALSNWPILAKAHGVGKEKIAFISKRINHA